MDPVPSFLRPAAVLAGSLGVIQSLVWMGLSITAIVAYYCNMDFTGTTDTMGSIFGLTLFQLYFRGSCIPENLPVIDFSIFDGLGLQRPLDIHAWVWVYLLVSFFWFISSCTLISSVKSRYIRWANIFLYTWILITLAVTLLDLILGVLLGLDYERVQIAADAIALNPAADIVNGHLLIAGQTAIATLFSVVLRGYVLWLINVVLLIFLFSQTLLVADYNRMEPERLAGRSPRGNGNGGTVNGGYRGEQVAQKSVAIDAFGGNQQNMWAGAPLTDALNGTTHQPIENGYGFSRQTNNNNAINNNGIASTSAAANNIDDFVQTRSVYDERKQFYANASAAVAASTAVNPIPPPPPMKPVKPIPQPPPPQQQQQQRPISTLEANQNRVVLELNRRSQVPQQFASAAASAASAQRRPNESDYSPPMPRVNPFEMRRGHTRTGF